MTEGTGVRLELELPTKEGCQREEREALDLANNLEF